MARIYPLFSSSKGNSTFIGTERGGILIDCGVSCKRLMNALVDNINKYEAHFGPIQLDNQGPKGRYNISVCLGTACYVKGSQAILDKISERLGIGPGECSDDACFSIEACRCIGACGLAPVLTVNGDVYGRLTAEDVPGILAKYKD